jgi:4-hydroxybenzoate polyprenyltransferase/phosphoserine phosphatase
VIPSGRPLCVDLDRTLVRTDTLHEQLVNALRNPRLLVRLPGLLLAGKAAFKAALARDTSLGVDHLPYNDELIEWIRVQRAAGRWIVLATAASEHIAREVASHLGIFDEVIASTAERNLRGAAKADALVQRFGEKNFDYAGDSGSDVDVWRHAHAAILVAASSRDRRRAVAVAAIEHEFPGRKGTVAALVRALRPHQWSKNLLVFVPVVTARAVLDSGSLISAAIAFLAFSAAASGVYVLNDLMDLSADRLHPRKRQRPFASGALSLSAAVVLVPSLWGIGIGLATLVGLTSIIALYVVVSTLYSVFVKEFPLVDIFTLAALYSVRLFGGGEASGHRVTLWLLGFSSFLFLGLAAMKRVSEVQALRADGRSGLARRQYSESDLPVLVGIGCSAAFAASVVLALYVQAEFGTNMVGRSGLLWSIVPLFLFWQCRLWLATSRGQMTDDPIVYAVRDWVSRLAALVLFVVFTIAMWGVRGVTPG